MLSGGDAPGGEDHITKRLGITTSKQQNLMLVLVLPEGIVIASDAPAWAGLTDSPVGLLA